MQADTFDATLRNLERLNLIDSRSVIELYNWGELFLHPDLQNIIRVMRSRSSLFDQYKRICSPANGRGFREESNRCQLLNVRILSAII